MQKLLSLLAGEVNSFFGKIDPINFFDDGASIRPLSQWANYALTLLLKKYKICRNYQFFRHRSTMKQRLRYLPLSDIEEGMVLGAGLTIQVNGVINFTLPAGHALTESNIRQIALRHGEFVCIAEEDTRSAEAYAADLAITRCRLDQIFSRADLAQPSIAGLYAAILAYRSL